MNSILKGANIIDSSNKKIWCKKYLTSYTVLASKVECAFAGDGSTMVNKANAPILAFYIFRR